MGRIKASLVTFDTGSLMTIEVLPLPDFTLAIEFKILVAPRGHMVVLTLLLFTICKFLVVPVGMVVEEYKLCLTPLFETTSILLIYRGAPANVSVPKVVEKVVNATK